MSTSYDLEFKESSSRPTRLDKDDRKFAAQEARLGSVKASPTAFDAVAEAAWQGGRQQDVLNSAPIVNSAPLATASAPLAFANPAPLVTAPLANPAPIARLSVQHVPVDRTQISHLADAPTTGGMFSPEVRPIHHTKQADLPFSSIPDSSSAAGGSESVRITGTAEETRPLLGKEQSSSNLTDIPPVSSRKSLEQVGEAAGAAIDGAVQKAKESITKAQTQYRMWKEGEKEGVSKEGVSDVNSNSFDQSSSKSTSTSVSEAASTFMSEKVQPAIEQLRPKIDQLSSQAKDVYTHSVLPQIERVGKAYAESVQPTLESLQSKATEQVTILREEGWQATEGGKLLNRKLNSGASEKPAAAAAAAPAPAPVQSKPIRRNAFLDARMAKQSKKPMMEQIKTRGRAVWNKALDVWEGEEPVVREYAKKARTTVNRYGLGAPLMALATLLVLWASVSFIGWMAFPSKAVTTTLPTLYQPEVHRANGPLQGPHEAGVVDKLKMKLDSADSAIRDQFDSIKESGASQLRDIKANIPSMNDIKQEIPSMDRLKQQIPSMDSIKQQIPSMDSIRADIASSIPAIPSMASSTTYQADDINAPPHQHTHPSSMPSMPTPAASSTLHNIGGKIVDLKDGLADRVQDRLHHVADAMPSVQGLKNSVNGLKDSIVDRLHPAPHHVSDPAGADVMDPENHVIELKVDGHVEERIELHA